MIFQDCITQTHMHTHCGKPCEICPAHSLQNDIGYTARKRLSTPWLWVVKLLYSGECVDETHQMVNLSKNQEVFLPNLICQNSHTQKKKLKEQKKKKKFKN